MIQLRGRMALVTGHEQQYVKEIIKRAHDVTQSVETSHVEGVGNVYCIPDNVLEMPWNEGDVQRIIELE